MFYGYRVDYVYKTVNSVHVWTNLNYKLDKDTSNWLIKLYDLALLSVWCIALHVFFYVSLITFFSLVAFVIL